MKIIPFHFITKPQNSGYRDCESLLRSHPKIEVVSNLEDADFVFYWSWGDDPYIANDMALMYPSNKPWLCDITGDSCWIELSQFQMSGLFFTTHPNTNSGCAQFQVPYSYRRFSDGKNLPNTDTKRDLLASFQGSFNTNPKRRELLKFQSSDIIIREQDGWNHPDSARIIKEHDDLMLRSKFTFCPVGIGLSSIRVIEAIFHGSIPILIEDNSRPFDHEMIFPMRCNFASFGYGSIDLMIRKISNMSPELYQERLSAMSNFKQKFLLRDAHKEICNELGYLDFIYEKALNYEK